jgi:hypothetical protein
MMLDAYAASHLLVREIPAENNTWRAMEFQSTRFVNNRVRLDHHGQKT